KSYGKMGRLDDAGREFNRTVELDPKTLSYRLQSAMFFSMRGQPAMALPYMEEAARIEPNSAEARGWLGQIYMNVGRLPEAQRETEAALQLTPNDSRLLVNAGMIYSQTGRLAQAEQAMNQAATA